MPAPVASVFPQPGHPAQGGGRCKQAEDHPDHSSGTVGEFHQGAPSIIPGATLIVTLDPSYISQHLQGRELAD